MFFYILVKTKANESGTRTFKDRLGEHLGQNGRFYYHTNLSIYLAPSNLTDSEIKAVESILIFEHKPALNRQHLDSPNEDSESIVVRENYRDTDNLIT